MMTHRTADRFVDLFGLTSPPVALAFVEHPPEDIDEFKGEVPSACSFWRSAESGVFYASAEAHLNCAVGAMVMGFQLVQETEQVLTETVQTMIDCSYISADETSRIPSVKGDKKGIVYGPFKDFPLKPDLVLLWLTAGQAMLFAEAARVVEWSPPQGSILGRPACAALPIAFNESRPTISLGCIGMRTFTEVSESQLLAVVPGQQAESFADSLENVIQANGQMLDVYKRRKAAVAR